MIISKETVSMAKSRPRKNQSGITIFNKCSGAGSWQYCRYTNSPLGITPLKEIGSLHGNQEPIRPFRFT